MEEKLDQILQNQAAMSNRIDNIETAMSNRIDNIETAINDMREENGRWFAEITTGISSYRDQQDRTADRVDRLEDAMRNAGYGKYMTS